MSNLHAVHENLKNQMMNIYKTAVGVGAPDVSSIIPTNLQQTVVNTIQFLNPVNRLLKPVPWKGPMGVNGIKMGIPRMTALPLPGSYSGEKGKGREATTTLDELDVYAKVRKSRFKIHNFVKRATEGWIDVVATQLAGQSIARGLDTALGYMYDNSGTNRQYGPYGATPTDNSIGAWDHSFYRSIQANRIDFADPATGQPRKPSDLTPFRQAFVRSMRNGGEQHTGYWLLTPEMAALLTDFPQDSFRLVQNINDKPSGSAPFEVHMGLWPKTLYNRPVYVSTLLGGGTNVGTTLDTMGSISLAQTATGGSLSDDDYYFRVAKIVRKFRLRTQSYIGRTMSSAVSTIAVNGGGAAQKVTITVGADTEALYFLVYASLTADPQDFKLVGMFPAQVYDDTTGDWASSVTSLVVKSVTPDTDPTSSTYGIPTQGVFGAMQNDRPPIKSTSGINEEVAFYIDDDETQGFGTYRYLDESPNQDQGMCTVKDVTSAADADFFEWEFYSYGSPVCAIDRSCAMISGLRAE